MSTCTCIYVPSYGDVHFCAQHQHPTAGEPSPLGKSVRRKSHTHKTGSPTARNNRRLRQLARENKPVDYRKKHKGDGF